MKYIHHIILYLVSILLSISIHEAKVYTNIHQCKNVYIDETFNVSELKAISDALEEWSIVTNKQLTFSIHENFSIYDWRKIDKDSIIIAKLNSNHQNVKYIDMVEGGLTVAFHKKYMKISTVSVVYDRMSNDKYLHSVILHEVGHSIGLRHIEQKNTIMYAFQKESSDHLSFWDLCEFCKLFDCNPFAMGF